VKLEVSCATDIGKVKPMTAPAPTPEEKTYRRVLLVARLDGWSILIVAGLGSLLALGLGDLVGMLVGLLVAGAGAMELRGHGMLRRREAAGMRWLVRSQLFLLSVLLAYCASRLGSFDRESVLGNLSPDMAAALQESGVEQADILPLVQTMFYVLYGSIALVTLLYQGGMALYYRSRTARITAFLAAPPVAGQAPLA
jgi:hypothetical protein